MKLIWKKLHIASCRFYIFDYLKIMEFVGLKEIFKVSTECYRRAVMEAREKNFAKAFSLYVDAFLPRLNTYHSCEKEFKCFYRVQLASYLCGKHNYYVALPEGDMISDLILDAYDSFLDKIENSRFNITQEGRINLLSGITVDFPLEEDVYQLN